jgi:gliding motility-associated-like protein
MNYRLLPTFLFFLYALVSFAQPSGNCNPNTPFFNVDLSASPNGTWTSSALPRVGNCCGTVAPDKCVEFKILLAPNAIAINFQIASGAVPPGALFYQINCGPPVAVGSPICLNGPGPYSLTFCKPGNNINTYAITSIAAPEVSPDDTIGDGCSTKLYASGLLVNSSITWNSVFPGAPGTYNSYLSCTVGCDSTIVTAPSNAPPFVDYVVCGQPLAGPCYPAALFCDTVRVYFSPPILNNITPNPAVFCSNNPSGIVLTGNINGGIPPYSYAWTNGANGSGAVVGTNVTYTATTGGNYSLIVYDANYPACPPKISNVSVSVTPNPTVNAGPDQTLCGTSVGLNGSFSGSSGVIWSGGFGNFSPNNTTPNATYIPTSAEMQSGIIILTLSSTGNGACSVVSDQVIIRIAPPIQINVTAPSYVCFGQTANITTTVTGGFNPYSYQWNNGSTSANLYNVGSGTYSVSVNSNSGVGCSTSTLIGITLSPSITVVTSPNNAVSCGTFAVVSATAFGGTGGLSYQWSNGASGSSTNVFSGSYVVTVTDALGCTGTNSVSVLSSNSALVASVNQPGVLCYGATTSLSVSAIGGFGGYTYQWSNGSTANSIVVGPGNYCVQVTDGGGCISTACANVTQSLPLNIFIPQPTTVCFGSSATISSFVSGGQAPYSYLWSNGQIGSSMVAAAGNYALTVTDALGCVVNATVAIVQSTPMNAVVNHTPTSCFGTSDGVGAVNVVGGTLPYYYSWSPYGGSSSVAGGLLAGTYNVTITDAIGCSITSSVAVTQPLPLTVSVTINNQVSCFGGNNGNAIAMPTGGNGGYNYQWLPNGSTSQNPTNLTAGNYLVNVVDSKGCSNSAQASISQPAVLTSSIIGITNNSCFGLSAGSATVTGVGGTFPYTYQWLPSGSSASVANGLAAGIHTVTITDANFCVVQQTLNVTQPPVLTASLSLINQVSCFGGSNGSAIVNPIGGTPPYSYSWNTSPTQTTQVVNNLSAGSYSATVTDSRNCSFVTSALTIIEPTVVTASISASSILSCSTAITLSASATGGNSGYSYTWSNGVQAQSVNVFSGIYTVTATDALGCAGTFSISVQAPSNALSAIIQQPSNICYGSSTTISVTASGGFGNYTYLWDNSVTTSTNHVNAGQHCVNVTDDGGCITSACVNVVQNPPINPIINPPSFVCPLGSTTLQSSVTGGQAPYSYLWNNGLTTSTISAAAGTYTLTISDALGSGCSGSATVTVLEEPPLVINLGSSNVICYGGNTGVVNSYVSGGVPNYQYLWSVNNATTTIVGGLSAGVYSLVVTDAIGCLKTAMVSVTQPTSAVIAVTSATNITCFGAANGIASVTGNGGNGVYYYYWEPSGNQNATQTGLIASTYSVLVADSSGCMVNSQITITEPTQISILSNTITATCGYSNGSATVTPSGGGGVYTYTWSPIGGNNSTISNVLANTYTVAVLDNNNCLRNFPVTIPSLLSTAVPSFSVNTACPNSSSVFTDLSLNGNDAIVSWSWDFDDPTSGANNFALVQNPSHIFTSNASFSPTLSIQTQIGCTFSVSLGVPFYPVPITSFLSHSVCANSSLTFTNTSSISPGSINEFLWNFGDVSSGVNNTSGILNPVHYFASPGNYTVSLTSVSNNSCSSTSTRTVYVAPQPPAAFTANNVCENATTQFTNLSGNNYVKWYWDFGDNTPRDSLTISPTHTYIATGNYSVTLTTVSLQNCRNTDTMVVLVHPNPIVNFNAPNVCVTRPTQFTDLSAVFNGSITTWNWDFGDFSSNSNAQNPIHSFGNSGIFLVTLNVTSNQGCLASVTKSVGVFPNPVADFSPTSACLNSVTNFIDLTNPGNGANVQGWVWAFGDGSPISTIHNPSHTYITSGTYNATLVTTNSFGCKDTISKAIDVFPNPVISFNVFDADGCLGVCTRFVGASDPPGIVTNWLWDFGDNSVNSNDDEPTHCYQNVGTYSVSVSGSTSNGCIGISTQTSVVHINPIPIASYTYTPESPSSSAPEVNFTNTSQDISSFIWFFGDNTFNSTSNTPIHSYENMGEYCATLQVYNEFGCTNSVTKCFVIEPDFTFYVPNAFTPGISNGVNDFFTGYGINISKFEMWIFDRWGEMIYHTDDIQKGWDGRAKGGKNEAKQDVYIYKIDVYDLKGNLHKRIGHVTLLK